MYSSRISKRKEITVSIQDAMHDRPLHYKNSQTSTLGWTDDIRLYHGRSRPSSSNIMEMNSHCQKLNACMTKWKSPKPVIHREKAPKSTIHQPPKITTTNLRPSNMNAKKTKLTQLEHWGRGHCSYLPCTDANFSQALPWYDRNRTSSRTWFESSSTITLNEILTTRKNLESYTTCW